MKQRALVKNAADPEQVAHAERLEASRGRRHQDALRAVMMTPAGRLVISELLEDVGLYRALFDPFQPQQDAVMYFNEGQRNVGLRLRAQLELVDPQLAELMDRERRTRLHRDNLDVKAAHTASVTDQGEHDDGGESTGGRGSSS